MSFYTMTGVSQPGDQARGISAMPAALRWNQAPLSRQQLRDRAARAVQAVDTKYNKDVMDVKILEVNESQQFVQLGLRANFSSQDEAKRMIADLKAEFGETPQEGEAPEKQGTPEKKWWHFWK